MVDLRHSDDPPRELRAQRVLPQVVLARWLRSCGVGVKVFEGCALVPPELIDIGNYTQIDAGVRVFAGEGVTLGRHVHLALGSSISGGGTCVVGDFAGIGAGVRIVTGSEEIAGDGLTNPTIPSSFRSVRRATVIIGKHAVLFTNVTVLPGVTVGEGAVVAAGSVVHRDLKPWGIFAGTPLVQVGERRRDRILELSVDLLSMEHGMQSTQ